MSVVVASFRPMPVLRDALAALRPQCDRPDVELIVARGGAGGIERTTLDLVPGCRVVPCSPAATLPMIRGAGLRAARGDIALLTEDNCVPAAEWVDRLVDSVRLGAAVAGGTVGNLRDSRAVDIAGYLAEYGAFGPGRSPVAPGPMIALSGANVAYARTVLGSAAEAMAAGAWEGEVHARLAGEGARFALVPEARVNQNLKFETGPYCRERNAHGQWYGSTRSAGWPLLHRALAAAGSVLLPVLLTARAWRNAGRLAPGRFFQALPFTLLFVAAWSAGEATGYIKGNGR